VLLQLVVSETLWRRDEKRYKGGREEREGEKRGRESGNKAREERNSAEHRVSA
jgi:hypothetical protein